jgi:hypothetical protein|tara:strand:+ start:107 stop:697 length:591 start_codon:yes stop_codon:yes gene_type:complete
MELIIALAMKFWQWTVLIAVVIIAALVNVFDKRAKTKLKFYYKGMPKLQPVPIATKGKGFWKGIVMWLLSTRNWVLTEDWKYNIDGEEYVIPSGFQFDGASIPKFLRTFFSPVGVLLMGGLVHDYAYKYKTLLKKNKKDTMGVLTQKRADEIFRDINIIVNGFYTMNRLAYWSLRIGGFVAWNGHRKRNAKIKGLR